MKRVGIIGLLHESNTFIQHPTTIEHFRTNLLVTGDEVAERMAGTNHEMGGFFAGLERVDDIEAVPIFAARTMPYGTITASAMDELCSILEDAWNAAGTLDGVLVAPHGATVSESYPDADGHWLSLVRSWAGDKPIIGTLDAHANVSQQMITPTDALIAYRSNPHLDQKQRGMEAAAMMVETLRGKIRPVQAAAFPPFIINIERQLTSEPHLTWLYELADKQLESTDLLSNSILLGFPYADVQEMGSSFIAVSNDDQDLAQRCVQELATAAWERRQEFVGQLKSIDEALKVTEETNGPVCLLDMGDNVGGGSPGDSTLMLHAVARNQVKGVFACLYDPEAVKSAQAAGIGKQVEMSVGGKSDNLHGAPFRSSFKVCGLYDGKFRETKVRHGGFSDCDQGPTAIVTCDPQLTIMLTSERMPPFSLVQLTSCELDPASFSGLIAKGVNAPVAAYREVCDTLLRVNTAGVTTADLNQLHFSKRRTMFPFESDVEYP